MPTTCPETTAGDDTATDISGLRKSEATRRRILDAAARVLRVKGYAGTRLADIAAAAGTQPGSLYYYFPSREALVERVLDEGVDRVRGVMAARLAALPADADALARLTAAIVAHVETNLEQDDYASANTRIFGQLPKELRQRHLKKQRAYGDDWRRILEAARGEGLIAPDIDLSAGRMLILGMLNWCVEWYRPGRLSATEIAGQAASILLNGLARQENSAGSV